MLVTLSSISYSYDGKAKKPSIRVTRNGTMLKEKQDYTVSYKDNKNIGRASITVGTGLKTIKKSVFKNCKKLGTLQIKSTKVNSVEKDSFKGTKSKMKISVPKKKLQSYKKTFKKAGMKNAQWEKL